MYRNLTKHAKNQSEQGVPIKKFACYFMHFHEFGNAFSSQNVAQLCMLGRLIMCNGNLRPSYFSVVLTGFSKLIFLGPNIKNFCKKGHCLVSFTKEIKKCREYMRLGMPL